MEREDESLGVRLLADVQAVFSDRNTDRLPSAELVSALVAIEDAPWPDIRGRPLEATMLARLLKPFGVQPKVVRVGNATPRGYDAAQFVDAWQRYLPIAREGATHATHATNGQPQLNLYGDNVAAVAPVTANAECKHRPPGEVDDLWAMGGSAWGADPNVCACCGAPARSVDGADGRCPTCRLKRHAREKGRHLVRLALDLGGRLVSAGAS